MLQFVLWKYAAVYCSPLSRMKQWMDTKQGYSSTKDEPPGGCLAVNNPAYPPLGEDEINAIVREGPEK